MDAKCIDREKFPIVTGSGGEVMKSTRAVANKKCEQWKVFHIWHLASRDDLQLIE